MVLNLALGLYTPPVGTTLFIWFDRLVSMVQAARELWPFYLAALTVLLLFSFVSALTLGWRPAHDPCPTVPAIERASRPSTAGALAGDPSPLNKDLRPSPPLPWSPWWLMVRR